jgi:hypothetical protein
MAWQNSIEARGQFESIHVPSFVAIHSVILTGSTGSILTIVGHWQ